MKGSMNMKRLLAGLAAVVVAVLAVAAPASAENRNHATVQTCEEIANWWRPWALPMGVHPRCWDESQLPDVDTVWAPARGSASGWATLGAWDVNVVATQYGDVDWMWFVMAHEMGHQWGFRVAGVYGMKPQIMRTLGMETWDEEYWADSFATCLGFRRADITSYGRIPSADQCWLLDHQGLLPTTSPRGLYPAG